MRLRTIVLAALLLLPGLARAADAWFTTSDGVQLHVIEAGPASAPTILFVPGWTMPAWIWQRQIDAFSRAYHVIALDPRGQGESEIAEDGYDYRRRGEDIADLIARLGPRPVLLVGWSLGVLDSLAYVQAHGDNRLSGLVLVDNSVGEEPAPVPSRLPRGRGPRLEREAAMRNFVRSMFRQPPSMAYLERLTETALRTPPDAAARLLAYPVPRSYWREAVYSVRRPVLYVVTSRLAGQAANLGAQHPTAETAVFEGSGHAFIVDEAPRFNALLDGFIRRRLGR